MTDRAVTFGRVPVVVANPLLEAALACDPHVEARGRPGGWQLPYEVAPTVNGRPRYDLSWFEVRRRLSPEFSWAIPSQEALEAIAAWSPIVEIGAGTGYWAWLLSQVGADVVAYDEAPGFNHWCEHACYHPVFVGNHLAVHSHQDRALMLCWPPMTEMAEQALAAYAGRRLIYVGEHNGGCCARDEFFAQVERDWIEVQEIAIPQWPGLHDALWLYERKG